MDGVLNISLSKQVSQMLVSMLSTTSIVYAMGCLKDILLVTDKTEKVINHLYIGKKKHEFFPFSFH